MADEYAAITNEDLARRMDRLEAKIDALAKAQGFKVRPRAGESSSATKFDAARAEPTRGEAKM